METVTLKMDRRHIQMLKDQADATGRSQAAVVRDLIDRYLGPTPIRRPAPAPPVPPAARGFVRAAAAADRKTKN